MCVLFYHAGYLKGIRYENRDDKLEANMHLHVEKVDCVYVYFGDGVRFNRVISGQIDPISRLSHLAI